MDRAFILSGRWVFQSAEQIRSHASVLVDKGRISDVGSTAEIRARYPGVMECGGPDFAVLPGFVNAHHHCYGVELTNQAIDDDFLEPWMFAGFGLPAIGQRLPTLYSATRLLKSGVTSVVDMCSAGADRESFAASLNEKADAYRSAGIRAAIAPGERWQNRLVHADGEDRQFFESLPPDLQSRLRSVQKRRHRLSPDDFIDTVSSLARNYSKDDMIAVWFGPTAPQWTPEALMRDIVLAADRADTRIQTHVLESYYECLESPRSRDKRILPYLANIGLLNERTSMAHMVWGEPRDFDLLASSGTQISCNPSSNLRLRSGIAPAACYKQAGIPLAIGMDGTTLADDEDMFAELRLALHLNRPPHQSAAALTVQDVFSMATVGGARVLGREDELGQVRAGFRADITLLNIRRITTPWLDPETDPLTLLLTRARKDDVHDVIVGGHRTVKDGVVQNIDESSLFEEIGQALGASPVKTEERALCRDLRPYLLQWYGRWDDTEDTLTPPVLSYCRALSKLNDFKGMEQ